MKCEWIRVDEKLPPDGVDVLVYAYCNEEWSEEYSEERYITAMRLIRGKWYDCIVNCFSFDEITHWMPLPEPPNDAQCERGERA